MTEERFREGQLVQIVSPVEEVYDLNGQLASTMTSNSVVVWTFLDPVGEIGTFSVTHTLKCGTVVLYLGKSALAGRLKILKGDKVYEIDPECLEEVSQNDQRRNSCLS